MKIKPLKVVYAEAVINKDKKWYEFWKAPFVYEKYDVTIKNGRFYKGKKLK